MPITVISNSSKEREDEIKELFNKMKPYLLEGKSYNQALKIVKNSKSTYTHTSWFKDLVKYGESQGFSKENFSYDDKYGLLNVNLLKNEKSLTGYYWVYKYYIDGKLKRIFHNDLYKLEEKVRHKGLPWKIVNEYKAIKTFELNDNLQENKRTPSFKKRGRKNTSGVKGVCRHTHKKSKVGFYWDYRNKIESLQAISLEELCEKVLSKGYEWVILDEELYRKNIMEDEERNKVLDG